jgi:hypothetical protein
VIPFKATVSKMVDHFESRANDLSDQELALAGRVLQVGMCVFVVGVVVAVVVMKEEEDKARGRCSYLT